MLYEYDWLEALTGDFGAENLSAVTVGQVGVEPRLPLGETVRSLADELESLLQGGDLEFLDMGCLLEKAVDGVVKLLRMIQESEPNTSHGMEDWLLQTTAAIGGALAIISVQFDEKYHDLTQSTSGSAESLVVLLKKIQSALSPTSLDLSGQTLILLKVAVRPEDSDEVIGAIRDAISSVTNRASEKGIALTMDWKKGEEEDYGE